MAEFGAGQTTIDNDSIVRSPNGSLEIGRPSTTRRSKWNNDFSDSTTSSTSKSGSLDSKYDYELLADDADTDLLVETQQTSITGFPTDRELHLKSGNTNQGYTSTEAQVYRTIDLTDVQEIEIIFYPYDIYVGSSNDYAQLRIYVGGRSSGDRVASLARGDVNLGSINKFAYDVSTLTGNQIIQLGAYTNGSDGYDGHRECFVRVGAINTIKGTNNRGADY